MNRENLIIHQFFSQITNQFPQKITLQIKEDNQWRRITYQELKTQALKVAAFLLQEGIKREDFVALFLENRPEWVAIYLGIIYTGLSCVPLDYQMRADEIKNLILDSNTKILFCSVQIFTREINQDIKKLLKKIVIIDRKDTQDNQENNLVSFSEIERFLPKDILVSVEPKDIASLIYTSGTTGQPKAVMLTHKNICSNFLSIQKLNLCFSSDNFISILPLHHTYPFMVNLIAPLFLGATITFCPLGFNPKDLAEIIKEAGVTVLVGVPQLFSLLHSAISEKIKKLPIFLRPFSQAFIKAKIRQGFGSSLRLLVSGGARLEPKIAQGLTRWGLKLIEGYGLTETSPVLTLNPPQRVKFGSVGKPIPDVEIKIDNPDKTGIGEIIIRGPNVMRGYFRQPDATILAIRDGWFFTGDLGYVDKDGYLFITGRKKEVIVLSSGKTIYPEELEEYYSQGPHIKEICILQRKEERFGYLVESLYAIVVPDLDYFRQKHQGNIRSKIRWELESLSKKLPNYKHIMGFTLIKEELPRTALKKIKRYAVGEKYLDKRPTELDREKTLVTPEEDTMLLKQGVVQKIINYISVTLKRPVYLDSHLEIDLGIDSLSRVELGLALEALLSIKIPDEVLYTVSTVKEAILEILNIIDKQKIARVEGTKVKQKTWSQILKETPRKEIREKIRMEARLLDGLLTFIFKNIFLWSFRIFWFLRIKKVRNLPKGPYLVCPNHASFLDAFVVFSSLPLRLALNTYFVGFSHIFKHPVVRWSIKLARLIPIDPEANFTEAMQAVAFLLSHKKIVCIFPEGGRSFDEKVREFKEGVGILLRELNTPVVPVYIKGSHQSWPRGSLSPRFHPLKIIFGKPFFWRELIKEEDIEAGISDYKAIAEGLREEVIKLACLNT